MVRLAVFMIPLCLTSSFAFAQQTTQPSTEPVVVVSDAFSRKHFAGQNPIGQKITLNGIPLTVAGVAPENFTGMMLERPTDIWVPVLTLQQFGAIARR